MKACIMQPYFFPYLGYYQLAYYVDTFVIFDDVNFIKRGWINRNNILLNRQPHLVTVPLKKASQNKLINEIEVSSDFNWEDKLIKKIKQSYLKSTNREDGNNIIKEVLLSSKNISEISQKSLTSIFAYCGIKKKIIKSSELDYDRDLRGQKKILEICNHIGCEEYVNLPGGKDLYCKEDFDRSGIKLSFISKNEVIYPQQQKNFIDNLSMIDILMNNNSKNIKVLMSKFNLS